MENLKVLLNDFVDSRLEEDIWSKGKEETQYKKEIDYIIESSIAKYGIDSLLVRSMLELADAYDAQVYTMQKQSYRIGFKDGLRVEKI